MAKPKAKPGGGGAGAWTALSLLLGAALIGLLVWLQGETVRGEEALERSKREYREMVDRMKPAVAAYLKKPKGAGGSGEDLLTFLSRKANQAGIPASIFRIQRNQELKSGGWQERSYTVNLQGSKDAPVSRAAMAKFVGQVETDRPAVRVKNLSLLFAADDLGSASVTFSEFEPAGP